jgi:hypothetical protein
MLHACYNLCNMEATNNKAKFQVLRSSYSSVFLELLADKQKTALEQIREKRYKPSELKMSRRVYSHWKGLGLLDCRDGSDSPKISFLELFWSQIVIELRQFGVSLENIKVVKDRLFGNSKSILLEGYLVRSFMQKDKDFFLLVATDGRAEVGTRDEVDISEMLGFLELNYIKINFNVIKNRFLKQKASLATQSDYNAFLNDKEISLLSVIREGDYNEIVLNFNSGVVSRITKKKIEENPDPIKAIRDLMHSSDDFCNLQIKKANGKVVVMETEVMEKT